MVLSIRPLQTHFQHILFRYLNFSFKEMYLTIFFAKWCYSEEEICNSEDVPMSVIMLYQTYTLTSTMLTPCTLCTYYASPGVTNLKALNLYLVWPLPNMVANHRHYLQSHFLGLNECIRMFQKDTQTDPKMNYVAHFSLFIQVYELVIWSYGQKKRAHFQISE